MVKHFKGRKSKGVMNELSFITDHDIFLFKQGSHFKLYYKRGSHPMTVNKTQGTYFGVWAPNAERVSVIGDFNGWNPESDPLGVRWDGSGIWEGFIPYLEKGAIYKYQITSKHNNYNVEKADPYAFFSESPPKTASIIWDLNYDWKDDEWMKNRYKFNSLDSPFSIYEVHLGSWRRVPEEGNRFLTYREKAHYVVDYMHQNGIGVILDWVPSHCPDDKHGLVYFDGTHLYEHADPKRGFHPEWTSYIFNHGRNEVRAFLISNALFWLDKYHVDGLRVDAVASMLYLDYARKEGEWIPNVYGGRENLEAISFLKRFNEGVYGEFPDVQTIAEESTAWPMVSRPVYVGGLGFGMKWNMGWMHDTLEYFSTDPIFRKYHHNQLTFSIWYAFSENFVLPLSHDEVVYGKGALIGKMHGDEWQRNANLRALFGYMYGHPGKKLLFMGGEFGQWREWVHDESLEWHTLEYPFHKGIQLWVKDLNHLYRTEHALYELDFSFEAFEWIDFRDSENSVISFIRKGKYTNDIILVVCNLSPAPRFNYQLGVPRGGSWKEVLNRNTVCNEESGLGISGGLT